MYSDEYVKITAVVDSAANIKPPFNWKWKFGDGETGSTQTDKNTMEIDLPPKLYSPAKLPAEFEVEVNVTDNRDYGRQQALIIQVVARDIEIGIKGPQVIHWADPYDPSVSAEYIANTTGGEPPYKYSWSLSPGGAVEKMGMDAICTFDQPGTYRLKVKVVDKNEQKAEASIPILVW